MISNVKVHLSVFFAVTILLRIISVPDCFAGPSSPGEMATYRRVMSLLDSYSGDTTSLEKAKYLLQEMLKNNPDSAYAYTGLGRLTYKAGHINFKNYDARSLKEAHAYFDKAIQLNDRLFDAFYYGAYPYLFEDKYDMALRMAEKAGNIDPKDPRTNLIKAYVAKENKKYDDAIKLATAVIDASGNVSVKIGAYSVLTTAYKARKEYDKVDLIYRTVIELNPESAWEKTNYSVFLRRRKKYDLAIKYGEESLRLMDFSMGHKILADAYFAKASDLYWKKGKKEDAIKYFEKTIKHDPGNAHAHYVLGVYYFQTGYKQRKVELLEKGEKEFTEAVKIDPDHEDAGIQLSRIRQMLDQVRK